MELAIILVTSSILFPSQVEQLRRNVLLLKYKVLAKIQVYFLHFLQRPVSTPVTSLETFALTPPERELPIPPEISWVPLSLGMDFNRPFIRQNAAIKSPGLAKLREVGMDLLHFIPHVHKSVCILIQIPQWNQGQFTHIIRFLLEL